MGAAEALETHYGYCDWDEASASAIAYTLRGTAQTRSAMDHAEAVLDRAALIRRWQELGADPDTPDNYELNEYGEVIMTPKPTNDHQRIVQEVALALMASLGHRAASAARAPWASPSTCRATGSS